MAISAIARNFNGDPNIVTIITDNSVAEITTTGYLTQPIIVQNIDDLNNGVFVWVISDLVVIKYDTGLNLFLHNPALNCFSPLNSSGGLSSVLGSGQIFVGNVSNEATGVTASGDIGSISNAGLVTIANNAITYDKLDSSVMKTAQVTLSAAQINNLNNAEVLMIAAPGAGNYIQLVDAIFELDFNTTAYTPNVPLFYFGWSINAAPLTPADIQDLNAVLVATESSIGFFNPYSSSGTSVPTNSLINEPLYLFCGAGSVSGGNSPVRVTLHYRVISAF